MATLDEIKFMKLAMDQARLSRAEDSRSHPMVGAVVVKDGSVLGKAFRGEFPGNHAEHIVLEKKLKHEALVGCDLYTTLEPCTKRNLPKLPCSEWIIERKIRRVFVGMLDPNQVITGKGILSLRKAGIEVELFPSSLMSEMEELNRDFIRDQEIKNKGLASVLSSNSNNQNSSQNTDYKGLVNLKRRIEQLEHENKLLLIKNIELQKLSDENEKMENRIIALCSHLTDRAIDSLLVELQVSNDPIKKDLALEVIGSMKSRGILITESHLRIDLVRLKDLP